MVLLLGFSLLQLNFIKLNLYTQYTYRDVIMWQIVPWFLFCLL